MKEFFLEIGTEEIPAGFITPCLDEMKKLVLESFSHMRIGHGNIRCLGTPRRLVISVKNVKDMQDDQTLQVTGPPKRAGFDEKGAPTPAALGFARTHGVDISAVRTVLTNKGEYLAVEKEERGRPVREILMEILPSLISSIPFRKSMRWGNLDVRFARPVRWITAVFGGQVLPFRFGDITAGNQSSGHRFMSPEYFAVTGIDDYLDKTAKNHVIADPEIRRGMIIDQINRLAAGIDGTVIKDDDLLDTVTFLVEYPVAVLGTFDRNYLNLPDEVLITSMRKHQKYFSVTDKDGKLLPCFIAVSNTAARDMGLVVKGYERVLRARLSDAGFFYDEDRKLPLSEKVDRLKGVMFQARLGSMYEKMERIRAIAISLSDKTRPDIRDNIARAAYLCKTDLVTGMVGEFPELQGIMGREYASSSNENQVVSDAIRDHYLPRFSGDRIPSGDVGAILSISDRIDTICGCFGIGQIPTGAADPFALRRHSIALINIIREKNYRLSLSDLIAESVGLYPGIFSTPILELTAGIKDFIKTRLQNLLTGEGYSYDVVEAVLSVNFDDIVTSVKIVRSLSHMRKRPDFEPLAITFKRAVNIVKGSSKTEVVPSLFRDITERELFDASNKVSLSVSKAAAQEDFDSALLQVADLKKYVDAFFDGVLVMEKDEKVKNNRLALLWGVSDIFAGLADFSRLSISAGDIHSNLNK